MRCAPNIDKAAARGRRDSRRYHVNGKFGEGYCVLDYWSSKAARDELMQTNVGPAVAASGIAAAPMIEELAVHNSLAQQTTASV